jgi:hypothetical protein
MSLAIEPIPVVNVLEPRTKINEQRRYAILKGGMVSTWKPVTSTSFSASSVQITAPPPSPMIIVDRKVLFRCPLTINFTGTLTPPNTTLLQIGVMDALRQFPISSIIQTITVTINNTQVSINMNDVILSLLRYYTGTDERQYDLSLSPSMPDQFQDYGDWQVLGDARNPLALYGQNSSEMTRGGFVLDSLVDNGAGGATVTVTPTEPIFLSPFLFKHFSSSGFIGVQTMDFNISLDANLGRVWSHAGNAVGANTLNAPVVTLGNAVGGNPTMLFNYITPQQLMPVPRSVVYPYFIVDRYPTDLATPIAPNGNFTISSQNIQLHSIPNRIYVFARRNNATRSYLTSDTYAVLRSITVNWNNNSGLLSSASQQDLYRLSVDNGCNLGYPQWNGYVGSVLALEFGKDIALPDLECPGQLGTFQLQLTANFQNVQQNTVAASSTVAYTLYIVVVSEGTFTIMENRSIAQIGVMSKQDVLHAKSMPFVDYDMVQKYYGGDFFGSIGDFLNRVYSGVKHVASDVASGAERAVDIANKAMPIVKEIAPLVPRLRGRGTSGGNVVGGRRRVRGGAMMSDRELGDRAAGRGIYD